MNKGMLTVGIIFLSLIALLLLNVLSNYSTGGELDYYLVKETTDAAMKDSVDDLYYRTCGVFRIDREKFVESFLYRFIDSVDSTRDYNVKFYDINEIPPKVSVKVDSITVLSFKSKDYETGKTNNEAIDITTSYDAILEATYKNDISVTDHLNDPASDLCKPFE